MQKFFTFSISSARLFVVLIARRWSATDPYTANAQPRSQKSHTKRSGISTVHCELLAAIRKTAVKCGGKLCTMAWNKQGFGSATMHPGEQVPMKKHVESRFSHPAKFAGVRQLPGWNVRPVLFTTRMTPAR